MMMPHLHAAIRSPRSVAAVLLAALLLSACAPSTPSPTPMVEGPAPSTPQTQETVVYVLDGDLLAWDETTGQSRTIFDSGDVLRVEVSDDGQQAAFLRRSVAQTSDVDWHEQSALWVVEMSGENPRELVSAETLRTQLGAAATESTNIPEMTWIPGTHRLMYNGWTYLVQAEGESHAVPRGLFTVNADDGSQQEVVPAESVMRFVVAPDGQQVALLSPTSLSFVKADGNDRRPDVVTFSQAGMPGPLFPSGVWTEDSQAFVVTGAFAENADGDLNFDIQRVPLDGSAPSHLAEISDSHPASVTFSPDGQSVGHIQYTDDVPPEIGGWFVAPLAGGAGPLAIPAEVEVGYASLHWSPDGRAFTGALQELCPGAQGSSEICDAPTSFGGPAAAVHWIDPERVLLLTRDPAVLYLVELDPAGVMDATTTPVVTWPIEDFVGLHAFDAVP